MDDWERPASASELSGGELAGENRPDSAERQQTHRRAYFLPGRCQVILTLKPSWRRRKAALEDRADAPVEI